MVNKQLIYKKLSELDQKLELLKKYQGVTENELENNLEKLWIVERGLHVCIQIVLDLGNHVLAEKGITVENYGDIFNKLDKEGIIPKDFADGIKGMAGFILVHDYARVDVKELTRIVNNRLGDFDEFAKYLLDYIE